MLCVAFLWVDIRSCFLLVPHGHGQTLSDQRTRSVLHLLSFLVRAESQLVALALALSELVHSVRIVNLLLVVLPVLQHVFQVVIRPCCAEKVNCLSTFVTSGQEGALAEVGTHHHLLLVVNLDGGLGRRYLLLSRFGMIRPSSVVLVVDRLVLDAMDGRVGGRLFDLGLAAVLDGRQHVTLMALSSVLFVREILLDGRLL